MIDRSDRWKQFARLADENKLIGITAFIRAETPRAWLVNDGAREVWLPKSQCEHNDDNTFTMPEWLAKSKGLI
jgi:hypothetical protein